MLLSDTASANFGIFTNVDGVLTLSDVNPSTYLIKLQHEYVCSPNFKVGNYNTNTESCKYVGW
jgi:hypothetical protein